MERKDKYNEIEELLGKDIPIEEDLTDVESNDPYGNVCISCEG